jgi:outer membrane lipoprotein carrier protein
MGMKNFINLIFFLSILAINISAQTGDEVLLSLQNKFKSINDFTADITQKVNGKVNLSGKLLFKKENNLHFEFKNQTIISDGQTNWNYNKKDNKVIISDYDNSGSNFLSINYLVYEFPKECIVSLSQDGNQKSLLLQPKTKKNNLGDVILVITKDDLIEKAKISDQNTGTIEIRFSNYKLNQKIPDSKFSFTPPEGSSVIDLR